MNVATATATAAIAFLLGLLAKNLFLPTWATPDISNVTEAPLLAPYRVSELADPFEEFEPSKREAIRSLFTKAFYEPNCEGVTNTIVKPVYFWPGDDLKLRCVSCIREFVNNSIAKNWAIFQNNIPEVIADLDKTLTVDKYGNEQWLILDEIGARYLRDNLTMTSYIPGSIVDPDNITDDNRERRPKMTFLQRDGYLYINSTDLSNHGLYRCFDKESRFVPQFVYYLIPIIPVYESSGFVDYSNECDNEAQKDFWRLDGYHRYRFFPRLLVNSTGCKSNCGNYSFDAAKLQTDPITAVRPESIDPEIMIKKFNLEIFVHWSQWTTCKNGRTERTRTGFCHIRKTDMDRVYQPLGDNIYKIYTWLVPIHRLLENVEEFRREGIMLFSGVMGSLLQRDQKVPQHCTIYPRQTWDEMHKAIINPLIEKAVNATLKDGTKLLAGLCFRKVSFSNSSFLLFGHPLFQNEGC